MLFAPYKISFAPLNPVIERGRSEALAFGDLEDCSGSRALEIST